MDRVICKTCGNYDHSKMHFSQDGRYIRCLICNTDTPLFTDFRINEITGSVIVEGLRSFDQRINNGYNLLKQGEFSLSQEEFKSLKNEYSYDYRTSFGFGQAVSHNFTVNSSLPYINNLLNVAEQTVSESDAIGKKIVSEAKEYYSISNMLHTELSEARHALEEKKKEMKGIETAEAPSDPNINELEEQRFMTERKLIKISEDDGKNIRSIVTLFFLTLLGGIWTIDSLNQYRVLRDQGNSGNSALILLIAVIAVIVFGVSFLQKLAKHLKKTPERHRLKSTIRKYAIDIEKRKKNLEHKKKMFYDEKKSKLASLSDEITQYTKCIEKCQNKIEEHIKAFASLSANWRKKMNLKV